MVVNNSNNDDNKNIYEYYAEINPPFDDKEDEVIQYSKSEYVLSIVSLILGFLYVKFAMFNCTGYFTTIVYSLVLTTIVVYLKSNNCIFSKHRVFKLILLYLFNTIFSITNDNTIKGLASIFLVIEYTYIVYSLNNSSPKYYLQAHIKALFKYPFDRFFKCPKALMQCILIKDDNNRVKKNIYYIFVGLLITAPVTLLVSMLLMSADGGMETLLTGIVDSILNSLDTSMIFQVIIGLFVGCMIFNMLYTNVHKNTTMYSDEDCDISINHLRVCPNMIVYTALTPLCVLYTMYIFSQIGYFINAFSGNLYGDYSYSEYARRGFFELSAIACINFAVIVMSNALCKRLEANVKPKTLKVFTVAICVYTLFIVSTAVSKMFLYINEYGLTRLRLFTTWFMVLLAIGYVLIVIHQFKKFNLSKGFKVTFCTMFAMLCFCRVDTIIAKTNVSLFKNGYIESLDTYSLTQLSDDAMPTLLEFANYTDSSIDKDYILDILNFRYNDIQNGSKYDKYNFSTWYYTKVYQDSILNK